MTSRLDLMRAVAAAALAQEMVDATRGAIEAVKKTSAFHRRSYHTKHQSKAFRQSLDSLELQLEGDLAYLGRCNFDVVFLKTYS